MLSVSFRLYPLSSRPPPLGLCLSVTSTPFPRLSSPSVPLCFSLSLFPFLFSLSLSPLALPCLPLALLDFSSSRLLPIHLTVYLSICLSLEAPRAARATCTAATLKDDIGSDVAVALMKEGNRFPKTPMATPLSFSPSLSLSLFLFLSLSLSGDECRRGVVAGGRGGRPLSRNLGQRSLAVVETGKTCAERSGAGLRVQV